VVVERDSAEIRTGQPPTFSGFPVVVGRRIARSGVLGNSNRTPRPQEAVRAWSGFRQAGIAYERDPRAAGYTKYLLNKLINLAKNGILIFDSTDNCYILHRNFDVDAIVYNTCSRFDYLISTIFGMKPTDLQGYSSTILTILLIGGIQLVSTGILVQ
jgi:hypothetical protein